MKIGPKYKIARRLGDAIFNKTQSPRFAMVESKKRANITKKRKHRSNITEYGTQLLEQQRVRYTYGISTRQLHNYIEKAKRNKTSAVVALSTLLERRLDNVIYRSGIAPTRQAARQFVTHGHIDVNSKRLGIQSYQVEIGDIITVRPRSQTRPIFALRKELIKDTHTTSWILLDPEKVIDNIKSLPVAGDGESTLNLSLVVQFYSRV